MAKKKSAAARKTRQSAFPQRSACNSKAPSNASSPSPQPADQVHGGRKKSQPRRSPSHNDPSKGIVFSFRIQNDPALSMTVDIRNYDQQFGQTEESERGSCLRTDSDASTTATSTGAGTTLALSHTGSHSERSANNSSHSSLSGPSSPSSTPSSELRVAGKRWVSDPALYRGSNVYDHSRNLLILHTRKPALAAEPAEVSFNGFHPYRPKRSSTSGSTSSSTGSSLPSTPALMHSGSSSSSSSVLSSPTSSPSSPTSPQSPPTEVPHGCTSTAKEDACVAETLSLTMDNINLPSTRFLSVRGLGGGSKRMQVIIVGAAAQ